MTWFVIACAVMVIVTVGVIARSLLRAPAPAENAYQTSERRWVAISFAVLLPIVAAVLYASWTSWDWRAGDAIDAKGQVNPEPMVAKLEAKLQANPSDLQGWLTLGRSYSALGRSGRSLDAYSQAYELSKGENVDAITGLGEALVMVDEATLSGRAGQLFEQALAKDPGNAKALWYGGIAALRAGQTATARDRLQALLSKNPPEQLRTLLERQIQDLNQQLGVAANAEAPKATAPAPSANSSTGRTLDVTVTVAPAIAAKLSGDIPLFILARDPTAPGPPLAVVRRTSAELPITVALTERDAMLPSRSLASVPRVQVVARLSLSGSPREQSGDFYGTADYAFDSGGAVGKVKISIDRAVP
jgi:cytochrome c-type biogenesis protein CcmH